MKATKLILPTLLSLFLFCIGCGDDEKIEKGESYEKENTQIQGKWEVYYRENPETSSNYFMKAGYQEFTKHGDKKYYDYTLKRFTKSSKYKIDSLLRFDYSNNTKKFKNTYKFEFTLKNADKPHTLRVVDLITSTRLIFIRVSDDDYKTSLRAKYRENIVGKWELISDEEKDSIHKEYHEFTKNGKVIVFDYKQNKIVSELDYILAQSPTVLCTDYDKEDGVYKRLYRVEFSSLFNKMTLTPFYFSPPLISKLKVYKRIK